MVKEKRYVFSARTTEEGLRLLNGVREEKKIGWDDLVIDAVSAHYELDKAMMTLPRKETPAKPEQSEQEQPPSEEPAAEQPAATEQESPSDDAPPKKKGKGKGSKK